MVCCLKILCLLEHVSSATTLTQEEVGFLGAGLNQRSLSLQLVVTGSRARFWVWEVPRDV